MLPFKDNEEKPLIIKSSFIKDELNGSFIKFEVDKKH